MRLYYFTTERFGLEAVRDSRLKIARINELNDQFEFLGLALGRGDRRILRAFKNGMAERFGLVCMSRNWHHPMLWAHYADKHRGLCLGFDIADSECFLEIEYVDDRPTLTEFGRKCLADLNENDMKRLLVMKFRDWEYEAEYRAFCDLKEKDPVTDHYFLTFSENMKLAQVVVGERSLVTREKLACVLGNRAESVVCFKARAAFKRFEVVENKLQKAWL